MRAIVDIVDTFPDRVVFDREPERVKTLAALFLCGRFVFVIVRHKYILSEAAKFVNTTFVLN